MSTLPASISMKYILWAIAVASLMAVATLSPVMFHAPLQVDQLLFFAEGRSLLNGLHPWQDLFETKPPIIFWISLVSIRVGQWFYPLLAWSGIVGTIAAMALVAKNSPARAISVIVTCSLALYAFEMTNGFETELFGLFPSTLGILAFIKRRELIAAGCFAFLALLKEPFVVTYCVALLFFVDSRASLLSLVRVVLIGIAFQLAILFLTGDLRSYAYLYLPEMLWGRVSQTALYHDYRDNSFSVVAAPAFIRALNPAFFIQELLHGLDFGIGVISVVCATFFLLRKSWKQGITGMSVVVISAAVMQQFFIMEQVLTLLHWSIPFSNGFFRWKLSELAGALLLDLILASILLLRKRNVLFDTLKILVAYYTMLFADTIGNSADRYFLFSFPLWIALLYIFLSARRGRIWNACALIMSVTLAINLYPLTYAAPGRIDPTVVASQPVIQRNARLVDDIMESCHYGRYLLAIDDYVDQSWYVVGLTKHSPYQIFWGNQRTKNRGQNGDIIPASSYFVGRMLQDINRAQFVIGAGYEDFPYADIYPNFRQEFTQSPPPCAADVLRQYPVRPLKVYFRGGSESGATPGTS